MSATARDAPPAAAPGLAHRERGTGTADRRGGLATVEPAGARVAHVGCQYGVGPDRPRSHLLGPQFDAAMDDLEAALASVGMGPNDVVRATFYLTRPEDRGELEEERRRRPLGEPDRPTAITVLVVDALGVHGAVVGVEATAAATAAEPGKP